MLVFILSFCGSWEMNVHLCELVKIIWKLDFQIIFVIEDKNNQDKVKDDYIYLPKYRYYAKKSELKVQKPLYASD